MDPWWVFESHSLTHEVKSTQTTHNLVTENCVVFIVVDALRHSPHPGTHVSCPVSRDTCLGRVTTSITSTLTSASVNTGTG